MNVAGNPTAAGTYFDIPLGDFDADPGNNMLVQRLRDGTELLVFDPQVQFENSGDLLILGNHVDRASEIMYAGATRYLGPVLATHYRNHMPIVIFMQSTQETHAKGYLCYLTEIERAVLAASTDNTDEMLFLSRFKQIRTASFKCYIDRSGEVTDYDLVTAVVWGVRH